MTVGMVPGNLMFNRKSSEIAVIMKFKISEYSRLQSDTVQQSGEFCKITIFIGQFPVNPADAVVLTVGIVVTQLGSSHFIAGHKMRNTLGQHQSCKHVSLLLFTDEINFHISGRTFLSVIVGKVVGMTVGIVFCIGLIVAVVVAHQIMQGESVMIGNEVHRGMN